MILSVKLLGYKSRAFKIILQPYYDEQRKRVDSSIGYKNDTTLSFGNVSRHFNIT